MARVNKMSVQKRLRERKKAEKAEQKREMRSRGQVDEEPRESDVASRDDLAGYGLVDDSDEESEAS